MTTDKKSSLSERFKALRDKVADAITAAEEEESSVAEAVSPEVSARAFPEADADKKSVIRRASDDEIASALMKFTWANDQPMADEKQEQANPLFEEDLPEDEWAPEADVEAAEPVRVDGEAEGRSAEDTSDIEEDESATLDRIIAEAQALLQREEHIDPTPVSDEKASVLAGDSSLSAGDEHESALDDETALDKAAEIFAATALNDLQESRTESEGETGFSWTELLDDLQDEDSAQQEQDEAAAEADAAERLPEPEASEEQDDDAAVQVGTGFAALLASLRKNDERKQTEETSAEEKPDISEFLQDIQDVPEGSGELEFEPDPSDVARLWEPRSERIPAEGISGDPSVDPIREETHIFTEDDLKNLPKDDSDDGPAETALSVSDYRETDGEEEGYTPRDFRPIRRRRYYRTGLVGGIMYFLFVICVSVALACFAWLAADDMLSLNKEYREAEVFVGADMDVDQVATELQTKGLIRYRRLFSLFGKFFHAEEKIEPGTYTLSTKLDYRALIQNMHHYTGWTGEELATVKVTIPEGKTVMETFQILAEHGVCPYETLMECAAEETFDYDFLTDIPKGDATRLEGYLFPDTYEFYADSSPKSAISRFLDNFGNRIGDRVTEQAAAQGYTLREILTIASLIEKEAGDDLERATIASVIYNRLQSTSYPYLQIDATIQYAMGEHKEHLSNEDLQVDSPYNTYLYPGLPPGPIANPGLASIRAALSPENTGYYFYALNKNGKHEFFSSYSAFERFINSSNFGG